MEKKIAFFVMVLLICSIPAKFYYEFVWVPNQILNTIEIFIPPEPEETEINIEEVVEVDNTIYPPPDCQDYPVMERWILDHPFPSPPDKVDVWVVDYKDGWVKYTFCSDVDDLEYDDFEYEEVDHFEKYFYKDE